MNHESFHLSASAADVYESQKVTAVFRPLALASIKAIAIDNNDRVIDIACGTGIVSRVLEEEYPALSRIVGVDLNQGMIGKAQSLTRNTGSRIEWHQSDVSEMPFADLSFSLAICQQGLQYFPDKLLALTEIRRVLSSSGKLVITVWSGASPLFLAIAAALETHVNAEVARQSLTPFNFNDRGVIEALVGDAGFNQITVETLVVDRVIGPAADSIPREIASNPIAATVASAGNEVMEAIVASVDRDISPFRAGEQFIVPQESYIFTAVK
jgi:SAM-dependent methyltransferase